MSCLVLQKGSQLLRCEISSASPERQLCCETRSSKLQKKSLPCFPMNLLNAGDSTNALSQQCWQKDRSHLLLPLCQHRCSGSVCAGCSRTNACGCTSGGCTGWLWEGWSGTLHWQHQLNMFVGLWCETLVLSSHIRLVRAKPFSHRVFYLARN